jgi:ubiquinone/menaquinone biosynthesis C-methylase UbiE
MTEPARSFDRAAQEYEHARPEYPEAALALLPLSADAEVLDLGAGTGKLTRLLAGRYARVVAVEPLDGMRGILEQVVPQAQSLAGSAEAIPLPDASVDGVFAGQSVHWFSNAQAFSEIARVLRPGGLFCATWNEPADPSPLPADYRAYLRALHAPSLQMVRDAPSWRTFATEGAFGEIESASVPHEQHHDRESMLAFAQSVSWIANRTDEERGRIARDLDAMLPPGPFVVPLKTEVHWTARR